MGGGYSGKFIGTQGTIGEHQRYQVAMFDKLPVRTKSNEIGVGGSGGGIAISTAKMKQCLCCREHTIPTGTKDGICPVCGWIDDKFQNTHPNSLSGKNPLTLNEARQQYNNSKN